MIKTFRTRQICFFYISLLPVVKFFTMPSVLAGICGEDLWISALFNCLADFLTISVLYFCLRCENADFFTLIKEKFGTALSKTVIAFYTAFFLLKTVIPLCEEKDYVELTLYMTSPSVFTFMPVFSAIFFICLKKSRVIGRIADGVFFIAVAGYAFTFALSLSDTDLSAILPVGAHGLKSLSLGAYSSATWFNDGAYFLFFVGNFVKSKKDGLKILFSVALSSLLVLFFLVVFYGTFNSIAFRQRFALTEISKYTTAINNMERFDYIPVFALLFTSVFSLALPFYFACELSARLFNIKRFVAAVFACAPTAIFLIFFDEYFSTAENFILNIASGYFIFFGTVFPVVMAVIIKIRADKEKKYAVCEN
ncbi:MAG: GerAB/ArcD/ProY family transporter [Clostridia bacterium]|nr:GerAB/ArcD/ProY family transporter [Clostridia bacterium]